MSYHILSGSDYTNYLPPNSTGTSDICPKCRTRISSTDQFGQTIWLGCACTTTTAVPVFYPNVSTQIVVHPPEDFSAERALQQAFDEAVKEDKEEDELGDKDPANVQDYKVLFAKVVDLESRLKKMEARRIKKKLKKQFEKTKKIVQSRTRLLKG